MSQLLRFAAIAALLVFVAVPAGTIIFNLAIAGLGVQMAKAPSQKYRELSELYERYANVQLPKHGELSLRLIDRFDSFQPERTATISLAFSPKQFGDGPIGDQIRQARIAAPIHAQAECDALLKTIAKDCRLSEASASALGEFMLISLVLEYVQQGAFGVLVPSTKTWLDIAKLDYPAGDEQFSIGSIESVAKKRLAIYSAIAKDCRTLRSANGGCSINRLHISSNVRSKRGVQSIRISGKAWMASFVPVEAPQYALSAMPGGGNGDTH